MVSKDTYESEAVGSEPVPGMENGSKSKRETVAEPTLDSGSSADPSGASADVARDSPGADATSVGLGGASPSVNGATAPESDPVPNGDVNPGSEPPEQQPPQVHATAAPPPPAPKFSPWPDRLWAVAASFYKWLSRPRVRLTATGVLLLLIGGLLVTSSVWTLPLVIIGALMVVIAWIGCRLDGRFAIEWGDTGTQLEFRAKIKAAEPPQTPSGSHYLARTAEPEPEDAEVVEGEAHTVEIDVANLKALIAAAETEDAEIALSDATAQAKRTLRVANE